MRFVGDIALDAEVRAIASGAITDGEPVIVNSTGTVSACVDASGGFGTAVEFESGATQSPDGPFKSTFDSNSNKVVIGYEDQGNSNYGTAVVATIDPSDNSVSYGTPVVFESAHTGYIDLSFDSNVNKVIIAFQDIGDNNACKAIVGTVSSTAISFGSAVTFKARTGANSILNNVLVFDSNANKTAVFYVDFDDSQKLFCRVISISGTTPSYGTEVEVVGQTQYGADAGLSGVFDSNSNKVVIFYIDASDSNKGKARVGTISGTDISFGTAAVFESNAYPFSSASAFDSTNNKTVNIYRDNSNSSYGTATVGTVSGTDISFGTRVVYTSHAVNVQGCVYDSSLNRIIVLYRNSAVGDKGWYNVAQVSGTTLSFGTAAVYLNFATNNTPYGTYDSNAERILLPYRDTQDSNKGKAVVMQTPIAANLTTENFIGFAHAAYADGQKATVKTTGSIARNIPQVPSSAAVGTKVEFVAADTSKTAPAVFDPDTNKVIIAFSDEGNSSYGTVVVATIDSSDNSVTYGSKVVFNSAQTNNSVIVYDTNSDRIVIGYTTNFSSLTGTAIVGTVSGSSVSFGSAVGFNGSTHNLGGTFDSNSNKVVFGYEDGGNSGHGTAIVGTVDPSDNSISFGSEAVYKAADTSNVGMCFDTNSNKVVIVYRHNADSSKGEAIVGTVSGTSISYGSATVFNSVNTQTFATSVVFDSSNNKVVILYEDSGGSGATEAQVGTVSGTSISFGTLATVPDSNGGIQVATFDSDNNNIIIAYQDDGEHGNVVIGTVSGTDISFNTPVEFESGDYVSPKGIAYDTNTKRALIVFQDTAASGHGQGIVFSPAGTVDLTIGQQYFVQTDGTLDTSADDPSVIAGTAIGASDIIVKG